MNKEKTKLDPVAILLDLVIMAMILVVIGVFQTFSFYKNIARDTSSFMQDAELMSFELDNRDYADLIQGKYINEINGNKKTKRYNALADYVEAASMYKIYDTKGKTAEADKQLEIMKLSRKKMGELTIFADRADLMFNINY